ncbi:prolyl oligopeptidase family serine peptidase [Solibacillus sp. FSL W7-1464]|uniref:prolyl oligopeptidase family serine peptidase n=1 Tax=Solibacillus sp. FSL W7-1464 TaxID=2921706 RepID=UPI0030FB03E2
MRNLIVDKEQWKSIPLLHVYDETMDEKTPVVIFLHGFLSAKEHNLHYAYQFVQQGVRVILPDALMHGERSNQLTEDQMNFNFWKIVLKSVEEVHTIYEELKLKNLAGTKVGIAGTSMGGIVTSGCLAIYPWIETAGICMGTTSYTKLALHQVEDLKQKGISFPLSDEQQTGLLQMLQKFDMEQHEELWANKPIIFWHGERDTVVPYHMSRDYVEQLEKEKKAKHITYLAERKAGHAVSRNGILQVTQFMAHCLA